MPAKRGHACVGIPVISFIWFASWVFPSSGYRLLSASARARPPAESVTSGLAGDGETSPPPVVWQRLEQLPLELTKAIFELVPFRYTVAFTNETAIVLWDGELEGARRVLRNHTDEIRGLRFFPCGRRLLSWSLDGRAVVWDIVSAEVLWVLQHSSPLLGAHVLPSGSGVLTSSVADRAKLWDMATGEVLHELHSEDIWGPEVMARGHRVILAVGHRALVWDAATGDVLCALPNRTGSIFLNRAFPDGDRVATICDDGSLTVWSAGTCEVLHEMGPVMWMLGASVSGLGDFVATHSEAGIAVWSTRTGLEVVTFPQHVDDVMALEFFPTGDRLLALSPRVATILSASTGKTLRSLRSGEGSTFAGWAIAPGGDVLATCGPGTVTLWDARTEERLASTPGDRLADFLTPCHVAFGLGRSFDPRGFGRGISARDALSA